MAKILNFAEWRDVLRNEAGRVREEDELNGSDCEEESLLSRQEKIDRRLYESIKIQPKGSRQDGFRVAITYEGAGSVSEKPLPILEALGKVILPQLKKQAGGKRVYIVNWTGISDNEFALDPATVVIVH